MQDPYSSVRLYAIRKIQDADTLTEAALYGKSEDVRCAAAEQLKDPETLLFLVRKAVSTEVRRGSLCI